MYANEKTIILPVSIHNNNIFLQHIFDIHWTPLEIFLINTFDVISFANCTLLPLTVSQKQRPIGSGTHERRIQEEEDTGTLGGL